LYDARSFSNLLITLQLPFSDSNVFGQRGFVQPGDSCIFLSFESLTGGNAMLTQYLDLLNRSLSMGLSGHCPRELVFVGGFLGIQSELRHVILVAPSPATAVAWNLVESNALA